MNTNMTQTNEKADFHDAYSEIEKYILPSSTMQVVSLMISCLMVGKSLAMEELRIKDKKDVKK